MTEGWNILDPGWSAQHTLSRAQRSAAIVLAVVVIASLIIAPVPTMTVLVGMATLYLVVSTIDKVYLLIVGLRGGVAIRISDAEAMAIPDEELPSYTVLVPAYNELDIAETLAAGVGRLDYPPEKLEILLLLEADDQSTISAAERAPVAGVRPVLVPPSLPRTKPKACNYAMAVVDRGSEYVTIYDAEDIPEPLQLRRAAAAFARSGPHVGCLQARLGYYNERQNLLTGWFAMEYDQWFTFLLPAFRRLGCVVPLGGTSNHIRTSVWYEVGGWDSFNVTEDADLGVRLKRFGYTTELLDSVTLEEANSDPINWVRQRSRWYKGYLQTFLVHCRHPRALVRDVGLVAALRLANTTWGTVLTGIVNLLFAASLLYWIAGRPTFVAGLFVGPIYYLSLLVFTLGNAVTLMLGLVSTRATGKSHLIVPALTAPLYWLLQSLAAVKALVQLIFRASYWEKTVHGLTSAKERQP